MPPPSSAFLDRPSSRESEACRSTNIGFGRPEEAVGQRLKRTLRVAIAPLSSQFPTQEQRIGVAI